MNLTQSSLDYRRIEQAITFLEAHHRNHPTLADVAAAVHMSEFHFQRLFSRWVGISPKRFLQFLTREHARSLLDRCKNVLEVTYEAGLSSPGRLHDLFIKTEAMTPGDYKAGGAGLEIRYGFLPSPFGECLLLRTAHGICGLAFVGEGGREQAFSSFRRRWPKALFSEAGSALDPLIEAIFSVGNGGPQKPLHLHVRGTNFQLKVWEALLRIPMGSLTTYQSIAEHIGNPAASRAVGSAVGQNQISFIIPCHRVLQKSGTISGYAWGPRRKKIMLGWESALAGGETKEAA